MKLFELSNIFQKIYPKAILYLGTLQKNKKSWSLVFIGLITIVYLFDRLYSLSPKTLEEKTSVMSFYNESLRSNVENTVNDSLVIMKERAQLLYSIENKIVKYLYQVPDYTYLSSLETYFRYSPHLLNEIPSCVPLEKGDYDLSSHFGYRTHPISGKKKKHFGLDFAAPKNKHVFATASGTVIKISDSNSGYGAHIIIKHRFGFQTLYGHLTKVLVNKGQFVKQHELIGTVGNSGNSTGNHLHYEVNKNDIRIDPVPSLNLKRRIYLELIQ